MTDTIMINDCERTKIWSRKHNFVLKGVPELQTGKVRIGFEEYFCITVQKAFLRTKVFNEL